MKNKVFLLSFLIFAGVSATFSLKAQFAFTGGTPQSITVCENMAAISIDTLVAVMDTSHTDTITWAAVTLPPNGTLSASYNATASGGTIFPAALSYLPGAGYSGLDSFSVMVTNGAGGDTAITVVYVTVNPLPAAISGTTAVCAGGATTALADDSLSGNWSSSNMSLATVGSTGIVTGIAAGTDTITYTLPTGCMAMATLTVNPLPDLYNVTGGGGYCAGNPIAYNIGLNNSDASVSYQLYNGSSLVGAPITGMGSSLNFGAYSVPDVYKVIATNRYTACTDYMADSAVVTSNPLPTVDTVTGGGGYCAGSTGAYIGLNTSTLGVSYQLYYHSATLGSPIAGTGSALEFGPYTGYGTFSVVATNTATNCASTMYGNPAIHVTPLPSVYNVTGGGNYCSGSAGVPVGLSGSNTGINYRLYNDGSLIDTMAGTGAALDFGAQTLEGSYSIVAANATTQCTNNMTGSAAIIIDPLPAIYTVSGGGGYCMYGAGVEIALSSSTPGIVYQLYDTTSPVGSPVTGTGDSLDFGLQTGAGAYTVIAINTGTSCISSMSASPVVTINPLPTLYTVTGGGGYCADGSGVPVNLDFSDAGTNYQLYLGGTAIGSPAAGTGAALSFGLKTASGVYTAVATNTVTGCTNNMAGSVMVTPIPLPYVHTVTGGGSYCAGGTGVAIGLNSSNTGVKYQLYHGITTIGSPLTGTGATLNFGLDTLSGVYTVVATDTTTTCTANMSGSATVTITPLVYPSVSISTGMADTICSGTSVTFTATPGGGGTSPTYQWSVNGLATTSGSSYHYTPANGDQVSVKLTSNATCAVYETAMDTMGITVWANDTPSVSISANNTTVCRGTAVTFTAVDSMGGPSPSYTWTVNSHTAGSGNAFTYVPSDGDIVYVGLTSDYLCRLATLVASNNITITVDSPIVPSVVIDANPGTNISKGGNVTLTAVVTNGGTSPRVDWYNGPYPVLGVTSDSLHISRELANDSITCVVTRTDACALSTFNGVIIRVNDLGVQQMAGNADVAIYPNPNKGEFTLNGSVGTTDGPVAIEISDMLGQSVYKGTIPVNNGAINEKITVDGQLANGVYLLNIQSTTGNSVLHFVIDK